MKTLIWMLALSAVVLASTTAQAVTIKDNGTTVYYDNFENVPGGASGNPAPDLGTAFQYLPTNPSPGTFFAANGQASDAVQAATGAGTPTPAEGSQDLRIHRNDGVLDSALTHSLFRASSPIASGNTMTTATEVYLTGNGHAAIAFLFPSTATPTSGSSYNPVDMENNTAIWIRPILNAGTLKLNVIYDNGNSGMFAPGIVLSTDKWQEWDVSYAVGSGTFSVSIKDNLGTQTATGLPVFQNIGTNGILGMMTAIGATPMTVYLDAVPVPEPSGLVLLTLGSVGLMTAKRRRSK